MKISDEVFERPVKTSMSIYMYEKAFDIQVSNIKGRENVDVCRRPSCFFHSSLSQLPTDLYRI